MTWWFQSIQIGQSGSFRSSSNGCGSQDAPLGKLSDKVARFSEPKASPGFHRLSETNSGQFLNETRGLLELPFKLFDGQSFDPIPFELNGSQVVNVAWLENLARRRDALIVNALNTGFSNSFCGSKRSLDCKI